MNLNFLIQNIRLLSFGIIMAFTSSFGQTFFISLFGPSIQLEFGLSHTSWGAIYLIGTLGSALVLTYSGSLIDYYKLNYYTFFSVFAFFPKRFSNLSTLPPVSTSFCLPV